MTVSVAVSLIEYLQDILGRIVRIREALDNRDLLFLEAIAADLEKDLAGTIDRLSGA